MNQLRRIAGIIWVLLGPAAIYFLIKTATAEIAQKHDTSTIIQWSVFVLVFVPIAVGLVIFGYYAFRGEYDVND